MTKLLLDGGADVNARNKNNMTALHYAARCAQARAQARCMRPSCRATHTRTRHALQTWRIPSYTHRTFPATATPPSLPFCCKPESTPTKRSHSTFSLSSFPPVSSLPFPPLPSSPSTSSSLPFPPLPSFLPFPPALHSRCCLRLPLALTLSLCLALRSLSDSISPPHTLARPGLGAFILAPLSVSRASFG